MEVHVKVAFLIIKDQGYNKVILILELGDHGIIKVNQQSFLLCFPVHSMNHVGMNVVFIRNLQNKYHYTHCKIIIPEFVVSSNLQYTYTITHKGVQMPLLS